jgi:hypothetical protein
MMGRQTGDQTRLFYTRSGPMGGLKRPRGGPPRSGLPDARRHAPASTGEAIEGPAERDALHPMQATFSERSWCGKAHITESQRLNVAGQDESPHFRGKPSGPALSCDGPQLGLGAFL